MIGRRVMKAGWQAYPEHQELARLGTIIDRLGTTRVVKVRWDGAEATGTPPQIKTHHASELAWLWWRCT